MPMASQSMIEVLGVPVPVIKAIMCRMPVPGSSFPTLRFVSAESSSSLVDV